MEVSPLLFSTIASGPIIFVVLTGGTTYTLHTVINITTVFYVIKDNWGLNKVVSESLPFEVENKNMFD